MTKRRRCSRSRGKGDGRSVADHRPGFIVFSFVILGHVSCALAAFDAGNAIRFNSIHLSLVSEENPMIENCCEDNIQDGEWSDGLGLWELGVIVGLGFYCGFSSDPLVIQLDWIGFNLFLCLQNRNLAYGNCPVYNWIQTVKQWLGCGFASYAGNTI